MFGWCSAVLHWGFVDGLGNDCDIKLDKMKKSRLVMAAVYVYRVLKFLLHVS